MKTVTNLINKLHGSALVGRFCHTLVYSLRKELRDCESVLDLGCGPSSPLQYCDNIEYSIGVEPFSTYLKESQKKKIHTEYKDNKIEDLEFPANSFDAVILLEVLEHLTEETGYEILNKMEIWASKKIILSTPNGYFEQDTQDDNPFQRHLSGWNLEKLEKSGFVCRGMSGAKFFYNSKKFSESMVNDALYNNIRFRPKSFFYLINGFFSIFTYYYPRSAFGLFAIKKLY